MWRGGVEAADHQPLGLEGQIGVLCEALQVHATQEAFYGGGGKWGPHQEYYWVLGLKLTRH